MIFTVFCLLFHIKKLTILNTNITFLISTLSNLRCLISGSNIILNNNSFIISQLEFISYILTIHFFSYTFLYWLMCKLVLTKFVIFFMYWCCRFQGGHGNNKTGRQSAPPWASSCSGWTACGWQERGLWNCSEGGGSTNTISLLASKGKMPHNVKWSVMISHWYYSSCAQSSSWRTWAMKCNDLLLTSWV